MPYRHQIIRITLFAIAMAFLESAVVVYLRALYYPEGFAFPLKQMDGVLAMTELFREAATMVMLVSVAALASKRFSQGLAWFLYAFAVWDIFYYVFLWLLIGWPSSFATWDLLFLLPVVWTGPIYAPVLNSLTMILLALLLLQAAERHEKVRLKGLEWCFLGAGTAATLAAYTMDYLSFMLKRYSLGEILDFSNYAGVMEYSAGYVPVHFPVLLFLVGEILFLAAIVLFFRRTFSRNA